ncbi:MAG: hypothetical protein IK124_04485 [Prevotella sp.]|nr:hypothetical protein [Prevotella sp.]
MSISVKNIAFSIAGTTSKQFNIELDGAKYALDNFKMTQQLLEPCKLEFILRKAPDEDINEIQFTTCGSIIGKEVKLTLQTDSMEQEIQGFSEGSQNADIEFEGWVTSAKGIRKETEYVIKVVAETKEVILKDSPDCMYYNNMPLASIVKYVANNQAGLDVEVNTKSSDKIFYTAQYFETSYQFLQRLAQRYGEWMFNNGKKFHFGKFNKQEIITLAYPSKDLEQYSANLQTYHLHHHFYQWGYNDFFNYIEDVDENGVDLGSRLNDITYHAWQEKYKYTTYEEVKGHGIELDEKVKAAHKNERLDYDFFDERYISYVFGRRANMLVYKGKSFCSKLEIGAKLTIKDNYISSDSSQQKSEVQQDEILITKVIHSFTADEQYHNRFEGIATEADYPPYLDPTIYPVCHHPIRALVKDNEDPKHWGRVRVRILLPSEKMKNVLDTNNDDPRCWTPWLHVVVPYTGAFAEPGKKKEYYGTHWLPETGSQVLLDFEGGNFERPYVCGALVAPGCAPDDDSWYIGNNNVKAIRTASGHTIEIHDVQDDYDFGDGGFIKIYDNHTHDYELLLSSDRNLIKLKSVGNIELEAGKDIIMNAQNDIKITAQKNIEEWAMEEMTLHSEKEFKGDTRNKMTFFAHKNMSLNTDEEMALSSEKDMNITCHKDRTDKIDGKYHGETKKDYEIKSNQHARFIVTDMFSVKSKNIHLEAQKDYEGWGMTVTLDGQKDIYLNAMATINISAPMIKES